MGGGRCEKGRTGADFPVSPLVRFGTSVNYRRFCLLKPTTVTERKNAAFVSPIHKTPSFKGQKPSLFNQSTDGKGLTFGIVLRVPY